MLPPVVQPFEVSASAFLAGIDAMLEATDKLTASIDAVVAAAERMSGVFDASAAADERFAAAEEAAEARAVYLADAMDRVVVGLDASAAASDRAMAATDALAASYDRAGASATVAGDKAETSGKKAAVFGGAWKTALLGVGIALGYGIDQAAKYQSLMTQLLTQAGVSKSQYKYLSQGILQLAGQVGFSPTSLAHALYYVESSFQSLGITGPKALQLVTTGARLAQIGHSNLADTVKALDGLVASGIPGIQNYSQAAGALLAITGSGELAMQDVVDSMGTGLMASAKLYDQSIQEVGAALADLGDAQIRGAKAGTDLRMTWQAILSPLKTATPLLNSIGLQYTSLADTMKRHGLSAALGEFIGHLKASKVPVADWGQYVTDIFGKKAGTGIGVLVSTYDRLMSKFPDMKHQMGGFGSAWQTQQKTMAQQWDDLKSGLQALAISFGTVLLPAATRVVGVLAKFANMLEKHPDLAKFAGGLVAVSVALGLVGSAAKLLGGGFEVVSNPVFLVVAAVAALAFGLYELYKHSKLVRDVVADIGKFFRGAWEMALKGADAVIKWFVSGPLAFIKQQIGVFTKWWAQNGAEVRQVAEAIWRGISTVIRTYWRIIWDGEIRPGLVILEAAWRLAWGLIRDTVRVVCDTAAAIIRASIRVILDVISVFLDLVTGHWSKAWSDIKRLVSDAINGVTSILSTFASGALHLLWDAGVNIVKGLIDGIKSMGGAAWSAVKDIGSGLLHGAMSVLGIASPSKKFYELGSMITTGLALGISETSAQVYAAAQRLAGQVTAAYGAGQITGSQESSLLARITAGLASRQLSLAKIQATINYGQLGAEITARLGAGMLETLPQAERAARHLMDAIRRELRRGQISTAQAAQLTVRIEEDLTRRKEKLARVMAEIGLKMAAGLLSSLENAASPAQAKSAVDKLIGYVRQAWSAGAISLPQATAMTKVLEADSLKLQALAARRESIAKQIAAAKNYAAQTAQNTAQWAGLSSVAGSMTSGGMMYSGNLLAGMQANLGKIRALQTALKKLASLGLRRDLLTQIIQMGPDQGLQVAEALIQGPAKVISQMNATQHQLAMATSSLGQSAANLMYDTGSQAGKGFLSGLKAQEGEMTKMMDRLAKSMVTSMKREMGIGGGGGHVGGPNITVHVSGFIGSEQQLVRELYDAVQQESLRHAKRNGFSNGLSLFP